MGFDPSNRSAPGQQDAGERALVRAPRASRTRDRRFAPGDPDGRDASRLSLRRARSPLNRILRGHEQEDARKTFGQGLQHRSATLSRDDMRSEPPLRERCASRPHRADGARPVRRRRRFLPHATAISSGVRRAAARSGGRPRNRQPPCVNSPMRGGVYEARAWFRPRLFGDRDRETPRAAVAARARPRRTGEAACVRSLAADRGGAPRCARA